MTATAADAGKENQKKSNMIKKAGNNPARDPMELTLLIEHGDESVGLLGDEVQDILVVDISDLSAGHALSVVEALLLLEHVHVEVPLQHLVRKVDAQLLQRVVLFIRGPSHR
jgi:hypothetical protein